MDADAPAFGHVPTEPTENWHFDSSRAHAPAPTTPELKKEDMKLIAILADKIAEETNNPLFASTAIITESKGFVATSAGRGDRLERQAWIAIANELGITVEEKHVDVAGYQLAQRA